MVDGIFFALQQSFELGPWNRSHRFKLNFIPSDARHMQLGSFFMHIRRRRACQAPVVMAFSARKWGKSPAGLYI